MREKKGSAPERRLTLSDGTAAELSRFWKERPLVLVFLRHFG